MPANSTIDRKRYTGVTDGLRARAILQNIEPGVIFDSHHGWHVHYLVVDLAVSAGFRIGVFERIQLDLYRDGGHDLAESQRAAAMHILDAGGLVDQAVAYLNEHCAAPGHHFEFHEGDFMYWPVDTWAEVSEA